MFFYLVGVQQVNCFTYVGIRKSGICFASKQNNEERSARNFCDDKNLLVEEIPGTYISNGRSDVSLASETTRGGLRVSRAAARENL